jgi:hypothetical protein
MSSVYRVTYLAGRTWACLALTLKKVSSSELDTLGESLSGSRTRRLRTANERAASLGIEPVGHAIAGSIPDGLITPDGHEHPLAQ